MDELRFNSTRNDSKYLASTNLFFTTLYDLKIFQSSWREELGTQSTLQKAHNWYKQSFEGGLTGNRIDIAARKEARKALDIMIQKILYYVAIFAEETDIRAMLSTGVVVKKSRPRGRKIAKPAPAA